MNNSDVMDMCNVPKKFGRQLRILVFGDEGLQGEMIAPQNSNGKRILWKTAEWETKLLVLRFSLFLLWCFFLSKIVDLFASSKKKIKFLSLCPVSYFCLIISFSQYSSTISMMAQKSTRWLLGQLTKRLRMNWIKVGWIAQNGRLRIVPQLH